MAVGIPVEEEPVAAAPPPPVRETAAPGTPVARQLASICRTLRAQDPEDAAPYLILRSFAWAKLQLNAPLLDHGALEAPPGDLRVTLKRAAAESDWDRVLELTEGAMLHPCAGKTWLDLQRYAVNAPGAERDFPAPPA